MKRIIKLMKQNEINSEAALGRGKSSSGVLFDKRFEGTQDAAGFTEAQIEMLNKLGVKPKSASKMKVK